MFIVMADGQTTEDIIRELQNAVHNALNAGRTDTDETTNTDTDGVSTEDMNELVGPALLLMLATLMQGGQLDLATRYVSIINRFAHWSATGTPLAPIPF